MDSTVSALTVALFTVLVGSILAWLIGTQVTYLWDDQKRRRESDLAAVATFYRLYGAFFATWKLWSAYKDSEGSIGVPDNPRWLLLEKAEVAESGFEALLVKLASERILNTTDENMLGCFREGYQTLRESIEGNRKLPWKATDSEDATKHSGFAEYRAFKALAGYVSHLIAVPPKRDLTKRLLKPTVAQPDVTEAIGAFRRITLRSKFARGKWREIATKELKLGDDATPLTVAP